MVSQQVGRSKVLLQPLIAGTDATGFAGLNSIPSLPMVVPVDVPLVAERDVALLWDVLLPVCARRVNRSLGCVIRQLGGHMRSVVWFVHALHNALGHATVTSFDSVVAAFASPPLDTWKALDCVACREGVLRQLCDKYAVPSEWRSDVTLLLAAIVTHKQYHDGPSSYVLLGSLTVSEWLARGWCFLDDELKLTTPLVLFRLLVSAVTDATTPFFISIAKLLAAEKPATGVQAPAVGSDVTMTDTDFEFFATWLVVCLRQAWGMLGHTEVAPASLFHGAAIHVNGSVMVPVPHAGSRTIIDVKMCREHFPTASKSPMTRDGTYLVPGIKAGAVAVVNAPKAPWADSFQLASTLFLLLQLKLYTSTVTSTPDLAKELAKIAAVPLPSDVFHVTQSLIVFISSGRISGKWKTFTDLFESIAESASTTSVTLPPYVVVARNMGFASTFAPFHNCLALSGKEAVRSLLCCVFVVILSVLLRDSSYRESQRGGR